MRSFSFSPPQMPCGSRIRMAYSRQSRRDDAGRADGLGPRSRARSCLLCARHAWAGRRPPPAVPCRPPEPATASPKVLSLPLPLLEVTLLPRPVKPTRGVTRNSRRFDAVEPPCLGPRRPRATRCVGGLQPAPAAAPDTLGPTWTSPPSAGRAGCWWSPARAGWARPPSPPPWPAWPPGAGLVVLVVELEGKPGVPAAFGGRAPSATTSRPPCRAAPDGARGTGGRAGGTVAGPAHHPRRRPARVPGRPRHEADLQAPGVLGGPRRGGHGHPRHPGHPGARQGEEPRAPGRPPT